MLIHQSTHLEFPGMLLLLLSFHFFLDLKLYLLQFISQVLFSVLTFCFLQDPQQSDVNDQIECTSHLLVDLIETTVRDQFVVTVYLSPTLSGTQL